MTRIKNSNLRERVGIVIRTNRLKSNMTQEQLGQEVGVTRIFINQMENGNRVPSEETLAKIAACFDKNVDALFLEAESEDVELAFELKRIVEEKDHETLQKLIEYAKTLNRSL